MRAREAGRASSLSGAELALRARALAFVLVAPVLMRLPLPRLAALLERVRVASGTNPRRAVLALRAIEWTMRASRPWIAHRCQVRGLARYCLLRRAGIDVSIAFGMGAVEGALAAHCWLVRGGSPFLERRHVRDTLVALYRIPREAGAPEGWRVPLVLEVRS